MKKNVGSLDRIIRILIGIIIITLGLFYKNWLGVIGLVPLFTALVGWCPLYVPLGISTCRKK